MGPPRDPTTDEQRTARYEEIRARWALDPQLSSRPSGQGGAPGSAELATVLADLRAITNEADDVHLRANAALLLGAVLQERDRWSEAAGAYRRATELVPDDAGPWMALARAEAKQPERTSEAIAAQRRALELDPDNLENFLALGELFVRAGDEQEATTVYAAYEVRRKGLIDGLTLTKDGAYIVSIDERIACAEALAAATDIGTAYALMYALEKDPEPRVRAAVVQTMGIQRLAGYAPFLAKTLARETDETVRTAIAAAVAEIERDPVEAAQLPVAPAVSPRPSGSEIPPAPGADPGPTPANAAPEARGAAEGAPSTAPSAGGTKPPAR
ncbi:MAG TPA: HEAT repeat domain-containing protein [Nannocystaceae bacterium]|nr:HEAT repeat domain-containing protein [Nannocystaceae bacterium]